MQTKLTLRTVGTILIVLCILALLYFGGSWLVQMVLQMHGIAS